MDDNSVAFTLDNFPNNEPIGVLFAATMYTDIVNKIYIISPILKLSLSNFG